MAFGILGIERRGSLLVIPTKGCLNTVNGRQWVSSGYCGSWLGDLPFYHVPLSIHHKQPMLQKGLKRSSRPTSISDGIPCAESHARASANAALFVGAMTHISVRFLHLLVSNTSY